jgi:dolichol-phosphate mannosyltransferase
MIGEFERKMQGHNFHIRNIIGTIRELTAGKFDYLVSYATPMSHGPQLSVVLPTLDEAEGLKVLLPRVLDLFKTLGVRGEILVVDGNSKDGTADVARSFGVHVQKQKGKGFGSAVREGLASASAEWVAIMDADGSHDPAALTRFWARREAAKLIVGSRYCRGGSARMSITRNILSRSLNLVTKRVLDLPVRESSSGFRLYHGPTVRAVKCDATDFSVQQDLLVGVLEAGGAVVEEPIHYAPRVGGVSKANAWKLLPAYIRLLLRLKARRGGWKAEVGLGAVLAVGLLTGLTGITGGLPGAERLRALPEASRGSPEFASKLAEAWRKLYEDVDRSHAEMRAGEPRTGVVGVVEVAPGWTFPPDPLINSARALITQTINPDEKKSFIILGRMRPWRLEFEPLYAVYGGAFIYPLGAFLAFAHAVHLARLTPDLAYYLAHPADMARLYLLGRIYALLFHLGTLFLLYELGRILSGRRAGAAAGLFWALAPVAVVNAHILKPHPVSAFWYVASAYCAVRAVEEGRWLDYLLCGVGAGLAAGGNITVGYVLGLPVLARLFRREGSWRAPIGAAAAGLGVLVLANPYPIFSPRDYAWERMFFSPSKSLPTFAGMRALSLRVAPEGLGTALAALTGAGLVRALFSDGRRRMLAALILVGAFLVLGAFPQFALMPSSLRLHYAAAALCVVLAADMLSALPRPAALAVLAAVLADTALRGGVYLENLRREAGPASTRVLAADWIDSNVPAGAEVGLLRYPEPAHTPAFRWNRVKLVVFESTQALAGRKIPEWAVADRMSWELEDAGFRGKYAFAQDFPSARLPWAAPRDDSFFANQDMVVLRRTAP